MPKVNLRDLVGKPFTTNINEEGYDCFTLLGEAYSRYGYGDCIPKVNFSVCACNETSASRLGQEALSGKWVEIKEPIVPCVVLVVASHGHVDHLGCYIGDGYFIHATPQRNVEISRVNNWKHKIKGFWIHKSQEKK